MLCPIRFQHLNSTPIGEKRRVHRHLDDNCTLLYTVETHI